MIINRKKNKKVKYITCVNCTKFCQNGNLGKLKTLLKGLVKEDFNEVVFLCYFNGKVFNKIFKSQDIINSFPPIKIGLKNSKNKILYFN